MGLNMEEPIITVIIPVYNTQKYLIQCVDSVLNQTYRNLEILLIDDGSTDLSGHICDEYVCKDSRIRVIHKENGGLSEARNVGLDLCKGEFISFLDSDDFISDFFIEIMYNALIERNCDLVALKQGLDYWDGDESPYLAKSSHDYEVEYMSAEEVLERMLYQHIATGAPFKLCRAHIYDGIRFPVGYLYEDVATTYKLFLVSKNSGIVYADIYAYRKRKDSIVREKFSENKMIALDICDQLINDEDLLNRGMYDAALSRVYSLLFSVFLQVDNGDIINQKKLWERLRILRKQIILNRSKLMRRKAKYAACISLMGMKVTHYLGKRIGQKGTMRK